MSLALPVVGDPSGVVSFSARDIAIKAMQDRKIIGLGVSPKAKEIEYCAATLNHMFQSWAARGVTLWSDQDAVAVTTPGSPLVAIDARAIDINNARLLVSPGYERPLTRWEKGEYDSLPNKAQVGDPLIYSPAYAVGSLQIRLWPVPTAARTILYSYSRSITAVQDLSQPVDVPPMWTETVVKCLAARLDAFGDGGDPAHLAKIMNEAAALERQMLDHDRPASYMIGSDYYA